MKLKRKFCKKQKYSLKPGKGTITREQAKEACKIVKQKYDHLPKKMIRGKNILEKTKWGSYIDPNEESSYAQQKNALRYEQAIKYGYKPVKNG